MRVVLDTNVFVSAVLGGKLGVIFDEWRASQFTLKGRDLATHPGAAGAIPRMACYLVIGSNYLRQSAYASEGN